MKNFNFNETRFIFSVHCHHAHKKNKLPKQHTGDNMSNLKGCEDNNGRACENHVLDNASSPSEERHDMPVAVEGTDTKGKTEDIEDGNSSVSSSLFLLDSHLPPSREANGRALLSSQSSEEIAVGMNMTKSASKMSLESKAEEDDDEDENEGSCGEESTPPDAITAAERGPGAYQVGGVDQHNNELSSQILQVPRPSRTGRLPGDISPVLVDNTTPSTTDQHHPSSAAQPADIEFGHDDRHEGTIVAPNLNQEGGIVVPSQVDVSFRTSAADTLNTALISLPTGLHTAVIASAVSREDIEREVREEIIAQAVTAEVVIDGEHDDEESGGNTGTASSQGAIGRDLSVTKNKEKNTSPRSTPSSFRIVIILLLAAILGVMVYILLYWKTRNRKTSSLPEDDNPTNAPTVHTDTRPSAGDFGDSNAMALLELLKSPGISPISIANENSPQRQAYQWLASNGYTTDSPSLLQTYALLTLFFSTNGVQLYAGVGSASATNFLPSSITWANAENWLNPNISICDWYPATQCDEVANPDQEEGRPNSPGHSDYRQDQLHNDTNASRQMDQFEIYELSLPNNKLVGYIPPELRFLTSLRKLNLGRNSLQGTLPSLIFENVPSLLRMIDLGENILEGSLPVSMFQLPELERLVLSSNRWTSSVPTRLDKLTKLQELLLGDNMSLGGELTSTMIAALTSLRVLEVQRTALGGSLPRELETLTLLKRLDLSETTGLVGSTLPTTLWTLPQLEILNLKGVGFRGSFPRFESSDDATFGLSRLESLVLEDNELQGPVPDFMAVAKNLQDILLKGNRLTGTIPAFGSSIQNGRPRLLKRLDLSRNELSSTLPEELSELTLLGTLHGRNTDMCSNRDQQTKCRIFQHAQIRTF